MRFVYMDESGNNKADRHSIVAGVVVHADDQMRPLEAILKEIVSAYLPDDREGFIIRGSDILNGNGYFKRHPEIGLPTRIDMLHDLCCVPALHATPVVIGHADKDAMVSDPAHMALSPEDAVAARVVYAHMSAVIGVERLVRDKYPNEVVQLVVENSNQTRTAIRDLDAFLRSDDVKEQMGAPDIDLLPLSAIRGSVFFCEKPDSPLLQLADICAYVVRGHCAGNDRVKDAYEALKPALPWVPILS